MLPLSYFKQYPQYFIATCRWLDFNLVTFEALNDSIIKL